MARGPVPSGPVLPPAGRHAARTAAARAEVEDIPALAERFLRVACAENNRPQRTLSPEARARLEPHDYPGNVRELRNAIERVVILSAEREVSAAAVDRCLPQAHAAIGDPLALRGSLRDTLEDVERQILLRTLQSRNWRMTEAASALGLERSHLYKKLKSLGIDRPE